ncbi:10210_t:CDS:2 [Entrophospora sp. SA101]|nr:10639_t:CDS:2 [Entrophospora sp. SA101]CAJ0637033.1 3202_t:CDS:2 [Entrophospora sp. SA101]CAJ0758527.1 10210_t:CDS:2 [Entrophospora sp. SA101]
MESMEENQGLKLVDDTSRSTNIPNNDEKTNNDDDNNKLGIEDNNKLEDIQIKANEEESIAFKLQFDEILIAAKLLENAKSNNNNRYYNSHAKTNSLSLLNNRRISEIENSYFTHQKSYTYQSSLKYHNYHNQAKHKRNNSSIPKLNLNGISNNSYYPTTTNRNVKLNPLSSTPYVSYDVFDELSFDDAFGLKSSLKEFDYKFNNNRHDSDWDSLSSGQGYPPLTPSSIHSSSSSFSPSLSPYYPSTKSSYHQHHHWFLDDKEFFAQQLLLEEERKLLEIQQIQLNDAIAAHQLRLKSEANNDNNFDPLFKFNLSRYYKEPIEDSLSWPDESFNKEFERPLQLNNNNLKFHRGHHRHTSELIKLLV